MKILYVEDDPLDVDLTRRELQKTAPHLSIDIVSTMKEAIQRLDQATVDEFDLLLTDLHLPDGNGVQILRQLRQRQLPIAAVVLTSSSDEETILAALKAGADDFVIKRPGYLSFLPVTLANALQRFHSGIARSGQPLNVLYVEDNEFDVDLTLRHISRHAPNIQLEIIRSASELFRRLAQPEFMQTFDVMLIDYQLPETNALDLLKGIFQIHDLDLPVVLITGQGSGEVALLAHKLGAADYLVKSKDYLYRLPLVLENAYNQRQLARERGALKKSEERYRILSELGSDFLFELTVDNDQRPILEWIDGPIEKIFGLSAEEFKNQNIWIKLIPPAQSEIIQAEFKKVLDCQSVDFEMQVLLPQGDTRWLRVYMHPRCDPVTCQLDHIYGAVQDITARKIAENALRDSEEKYRTLFEQIPDAIIIFDQKSHYFLDCNQVALQRYGYSLDELRQMTPYDLHPPEEYPLVDKTIDQTFSGKPNTYTHITKDGRRIDVEVVSQMITYAGRLAQLSIIRDVTERRKAQHDLLLTRFCIDKASEGIYWLDPAYNFLYANESACRMLGYSPEEVLNINLASIDRLLKPEDAVRHWEKLKEKGSRTYEMNLYHRDGSIRPVEVSENFMKYQDEEISIAFVRDISERKRQERQIQRQIERLSALQAVDISITSSMDLRFTLQVLLQQVISRLKVDAAQVLTLNPHTQTLDYTISQGFRSNLNLGISIRMGQSFAGQAALDRRQIMKTDFANEAVSASVEFRRFAQAEGFVFYIATPLIAKGKVRGVLEIFNRSPFEPDPEWLDFVDALVSQAAIAMDNAAMFEDLQNANARLHLAYDATIEGWSRALELRNREIEGHAQRVTELTMKVGRMVGISDSELVHLRRGALLHDIGKLAIPDQILMKPGPLTEQEWEIMVRHPILSYEMLSPIEFLHPALDIPYCHHEKWDGSGYPRGLRGEQIPLAARVFAVVDVYDALCSDRPYQKAWQRDKALAYITQQSGRQFDPAVVAAFLSVIQSEPPE